jgi:hypothetical protein
MHQWLGSRDSHSEPGVSYVSLVSYFPPKPAATGGWPNTNGNWFYFPGVIDDVRI